MGIPVYTFVKNAVKIYLFFTFLRLTFDKMYVPFWVVNFFSLFISSKRAEQAGIRKKVLCRNGDVTIGLTGSFTIELFFPFTQGLSSSYSSPEFKSASGPRHSFPMPPSCLSLDRYSATHESVYLPRAFSYSHHTSSQQPILVVVDLRPTSDPAQGRIAMLLSDESPCGCHEGAYYSAAFFGTKIWES
ncbi:hypothetical protein BC827DRAFT_169816 [Russula dissimulans]|nr:hypothetical protein BC827DRAFT_169816 [Russula dissimulans]